MVCSEDEVKRVHRGKKVWDEQQDQKVYLVEAHGAELDQRLLERVTGIAGRGRGGRGRAGRGRAGRGRAGRAWAGRAWCGGAGGAGGVSALGLHGGLPRPAPPPPPPVAACAVSSPRR
ncbi:unnamed protein product [Chrysodeixis includens]|uniref:Uncharacterized protein n=1 Tax=Chrysodeixis includens TaxID=689277 RepID=A0A9N8KXQ4_CHRIL|nr:unnamed protein product [Chrysodeixis includens]